MESVQTDPFADEIEKAWLDVLANWHDEQAHKRFIALCSSLERLDLAGGYYRQISDADPDRREEAKKRISDIIAASTELLYGQIREPPRRQTKLFIGALIMSVSMIVYVLWLIFLQ
jgi:hypothetical protein